MMEKATEGLHRIELGAPLSDSPSEYPAAAAPRPWPGARFGQALSFASRYGCYMTPADPSSSQQLDVTCPSVA